MLVRMSHVVFKRSINMWIGYRMDLHGEKVSQRSPGGIALGTGIGPIGVRNPGGIGIGLTVRP